MTQKHDELEFTRHLKVIDFDYFSATLDLNPSVVTAFLTEQIDLTSARPCKPRYGYQRGSLVVRGSRRFAAVFWGGNGDLGCHIRTYGDAAPIVRELLKTLGLQHGEEPRVTRVDARLDRVEPGFFDIVAEQCMGVAKQRGLKISQNGDWMRGRARTLYIGARKSETMIRIYEKGWKDGGDPNWVRIELELKPRTRQRQRAAADLSPCEVLLSGIGSPVLESLDLDLGSRATLPTVYRAASVERARNALVQQYGRTLRIWADEVGGFTALGQELGVRTNQTSASR